MSNTNTTFTIGGDLTINRMGYGAMRITGKGVWGQPEHREEAIKVLQALPAAGVNFIDTADSYGPYVSEELITEALHPYPAGMVIATKGGFERTGPNEWHINSHPDHLKKALEGSLKRLKIDQIDLYQLHRIDPKVPFEKTLEFLKDAQRQGLVKHIGLSEVSIADIKKAREYVDVVSLQNKYSIVYRNWEAELNYCEQEGIAFIPWNPINAGNILYVEKLKEIAARHNATMQQVALSWLYHHSANILLIPGTSKVAHLEENVKAVDVILTDGEMKELGDLKD
jgi:aryl-alcohol dehydrogenase-like predicted oxidoreductase